MADDDIIKQAAIRRERNKSKNRIGGDLFVDGPRTPIPSPRQDPRGRRSQLVSNGAVSDITDREQPQVDRDLLIPRRMNTHRRSFGNVEKTTYHTTKRSVTDTPCLPFIECKLNGKSVKALLNTCVMSSIINRHMFQHIFGSDENMKFMGDMATGVPITIEERTLQFDFHTRGDIPDVVLGLDFLTSFKCSLNLGDKTLALGSVSDSDYVCTKLISDRELPLRYRTGTNLAASV
ncbi:uncharacterized protein LOC110465856 isoform X1 [Mizuhopecten yessoensis]|uniref:uncharacterized protein LOC110465856 isoform X1 n=1 Tax=Mizuhopecten yessoensis TaxID=6573 RepID=UPI000B45C3CA|nr:uncharacterized protein LOC110465856 isoform X1 [Mizuhopecten yessoensis]XP_021377655.1 uncharacterized protein LOC110465856 isoform X1 [Mizuhopecten yessoensis]